LEPRRWNVPALLYAVVVAFTLLMMLASVPYGFYTVFYTHLSNIYSSQTQLDGVPFYIGLATVRLPLNPTYGVLFTVLTAAILVFIALAAFQGGGFFRALKDSGREGMGALFRNPLSATIVILGATLLATVLLNSVQTAVGIQTGGITSDPLELLVSFTLAPFIEEIGYRLFIIGLPLFIVMLVTRSPLKRSVRALWRPSASWQEEQQSSLSDAHKLLVYLLIVLSSVLFGVAHYAANSGWDVGKISEAALDGFALAYVYVRYGLHTSIIFHWVVDYASNAFAFYGQAVYGIPWTSNSIFSAVPTVDILVLVGVPGLFYVLYRSIMWSIYRRRLAPAAEPIPSQAQPS
jgi:hypothetical protein